MRISIAIALTATLSIAGASGAEIGRSISDWIWPLAVDEYPLIQQAASVPARSAVEPLVYRSQEEGRRRSDKRFVNKKDVSSGVAVSVHVSKNKNKNDNNGHNTPIKPTNGRPIYIAGYNKPQQSAAPVHVVVEDSNSSWGWGWIKGIMNWGDSSYGSVSDKFVPPHHHHLQQQEQEEHEEIEDDSGIVSVSYGKPSDSYYNGDHQDLGMYNPFKGWWNYNNKGGYNVASPTVEEEPYDEASMSEVMVIRYPEFIKTIGKGLSKVTNAMKNLGQGMSDSLKKGIHDTSAGIGTGVASIIPLEEVGNNYHDKGGHGEGLSFIKPKPSQQSVASPSSPGTSQVYVDKHQSVPQISSGGPEWLYPSNWFKDQSKPDDSETVGGSSSSTIYVERPKIPLFGNQGAHHHHDR